jgi:hypothetical protein
MDFPVGFIKLPKLFFDVPLVVAEGTNPHGLLAIKTPLVTMKIVGAEMFVPSKTLK